ncbi:MAG: hypothetical protein GXO43_00420, partial [Crenarchaeota archaeon]|nr:hypothetical protein [Thermoproteota archaeon]
SGIVTDIPQAFYKVIVKIGSDITANPDMNAVIQSREDSPWVEVAESRTFLSIKEYSEKRNISSTGIQRIVGGRLISPIPPYSLLEINVPNETGYAIFIIQDGNVTKVLGLWGTDGIVGAGLWVKRGDSIKLRRVYSGNNGFVVMPWSDLFSPFDAENGKKVVQLWFYKGSLSYVEFVDLGGIGGLLIPKAEPFIVKLWVWDEP